MSGLHGLLPLLECRRDGEAGIDRVRHWHGDAVWNELPAWTREPLGAALSRSHSPLGNSVLDGRTEDLLGLGMVPKLARDPRAWIFDHNDGFESCLWVVTGVVADINVALRSAAAGASIRSAQLYRPPPPGEHEFSRLMERVEMFFETGRGPFSMRRNLLIASIADAMTRVRREKLAGLDLSNH